MLEQLAAPVVVPVSLALAKSWARETTVDNDSDIARLIRVAVSAVERTTKNALVYRPVREQFDYFLPYFEISGFPARGVSAITYLDPTNALQTLPAGNYLFDGSKGQARLTPAYGTYFPPTRVVMNSVQIYYDIGLVCPITAFNLATGTATIPGHNAKVGDPVQFSLDGGGVAAFNTGALPNEIVPGTVYYVQSVAGNNVTLSATVGGAAIVGMTGVFTAPAFLGSLPDEFIQAMALLIDFWHRNRSSASPTQVFSIDGMGAVEALLTPYMPRGF